MPAKPPFNELIGSEITRKEAGRAEASLELAPHHTNRLGVAHGGVICSLLDTALGTAVFSAIADDWWCVTTSLSIQFLDSARRGLLVAEGRVDRQSDKVAFASGELRDAGGKVIATASGTYHLWPLSAGARPAAAAGPCMVLKESGERINVGKIIGIGRNYAEHIKEMGAPKSGPPVIFLKPPTAIVHEGGEVRLPAGAGDVHHEVELVVAIGKPGKGIVEEEALDYVLGYAVGLDMTLRDIQDRAKERGTPWALAKGFDSSAPLSAVVLRDEVGDGSGLAISLDVNGERRQESDTSQMLRSVAELVAHASQLMTLERGDLIYTGTPAGVGPVSAGDELVASIARVGTLSVTVAADRE
jgi:5-carboxymethyl-2-hydroxymuconate isomerase